MPDKYTNGSGDKLNFFTSITQFMSYYYLAFWVTDGKLNGASIILTHIVVPIKFSLTTEPT